MKRTQTAPDCLYPCKEQTEVGEDDNNNNNGTIVRGEYNTVPFESSHSVCYTHKSLIFYNIINFNIRKESKYCEQKLKQLNRQA